MKLKYKIMMAILVVAIGLCLMVYQSYALWVVTLTGQEQIVEVGCFNIEFIENSNSIALNNTYPMSDERGMSGEAYSFTITNKCTVDSAYQVTLNTLTTNTMGDDKVKYVIYEGTSKPSTGSLVTSASINADKANITVANLKESYIIASGELKGAEEENGNGESVTYNVYLWIDENAGNEVENTKFEASINIVNASTRILEGYEKCVADYGEDSPQCQIMAQLDTTGACPEVLEDGTVNVTSIESENGYICSAPDDYGTSYYFRGNVTNNYVEFAGYHWRILRVNGDGSIRIIYDGTSTHANGESSTDRQIRESAYNSTRNDNAYVGYMYGTPGSSTYEETHANINNSTIKTVVDEWYVENIANHPEYTEYISDSLFCNDRSISEYTPSSSYTNLGYGSEVTAYRWYYGPWTSGTNKTNPRLTCAQQNDRFTVDDEVTGNGALTYPVGLLTTDEVVLAGEYNTTNYNYYLYMGNAYWTMSPNYFHSPGARVRYVTHSYSNNSVDESYGVRPVISLKPNSLTSGDGSASNPFLVG